MRRFIFLVSLVIAFVAPVAFAQERIVSFEATAQVQEDGSVIITEAITYDFGQEQRHGIYRDIPLTKKADGQVARMDISDVRVTDEQGTPYEFEISGFHEKEIKIGNADELITGTHTYLITYTLHRAVGLYEDFDELYWNVTGVDWQVPIEKVSAVIQLPKAFTNEQLKAACYVGEMNSQAGCEQLIMGTGSVTFLQDQLMAGDGLTVAVGFPKGAVVGPTAWDVFVARVLAFGWLLVPIAVFIYLFRTWWRMGRDAKGRGTIPVQYDAPDGLSPLALGTLIDGSVGNRDITAEIVYLAERGYIKIHRVEEKQVIIFDKTDYALVKLKEAGDELRGYQKTLFTALFEPKNMDEAVIDGVPTSVARVSRFGKNKFYVEVQKVQKEAYEQLTASGYYRQNPSKVKGKYVILGFFITFVGLWAMVIPQLGGALSISGVLTMIFGAMMPALTAKGVAAKEHIVGLMEYIEAAEKRRIDFHNAPEKNPQEFERLLPAAIALGIEKKWAKQFENITIQPSWYGGQQGAFNAVMLTNNLSSFQSMAGASFSGSSGHGSGGGGGVGGGGGGGGGGSW